MGTTRIKVIDLSSEQKEIKTSRKHAEKLTAVGRLTTKKKPKAEGQIQEAIAESTQIIEGTEPHTQAESSLPSDASEPSVIKTKSKTPKIRTRGKKYRQAQELVEKNKVYSAKEAIELLHKISYSKFDPTVEAHFNVIEKSIRGSVDLPHKVGKKKQKVILVFTDKKLPQDKNILIGNVKTIDDIQNGKLRPARDFNAVIAEPKFMASLVKIAKILGPAGLMPNPKDKTIAENPLEAIQKLTNGKDFFEFKTDPTTPVIHLTLGKLSTKPDYLEENLKSIISAIGPAKIKKATVKSTMSPAIRLDVSSFASLPR